MVEQTTDLSTYEQASGTVSETRNMSTAMHSAGNLGTVSQHVVENVLETRPQPLRCEVCEITCNTADVLEKHKQGKRHLKSLQKLTDSSANAPNVAIETSVGELENKKHRVLQNGGSSGTIISCNICNVVCTNQDIFQKHVAGKKHSAKAIMLQASTSGVFDPISASGGGSQKKPETLQCELCKISCTSNELLTMHMQGKKHLKKLKESGQIPNLPFNSFAPLETPTINPMVNPESDEGKTVKPVVISESNLVRCELCGISCNTYDVLNKHMAGKKHQKNLEKSQIPIGPNTAPTTEPAVAPEVIGPLQEEGKSVDSDGSSRKTKRAGSQEDVETKKQKILQGGGSLDAVRTCTLCNVVCNSPSVFEAHLAGQKHVAMAVKQAETQSTGQES